MATSPRPRRSALFDALRSTAPAALLVLLLGVLAALQVRWLEQMRDADRERTRATLEASLRRVADDFNDALARIFTALQPLRAMSLERATEDEDDREASTPPGTLPELLLGLLDDWRERADFPDLVRAVYVADPGEAGVLWRLDAAGAAAVERAELPAELAEMVASLAAVKRRGLRHPRPDHLAADVPALLVPLILPPPRGRARFEDANPRSRRGRRDGPAVRGLALVHLDRATMVEEMVPALVDRAFRRLDFHLRLAPRQDPGQTLLELGPPAGDGIDAEVELFGPLALDRRWSRGRRLGDFKEDAEKLRGRWLLRASHPAGSLARAVDRAHRRNLATSLGILAVLAAALVLLARGAARARGLARRQLDFVAGVTHELMTPLAALRSAGQNLADGVVTEPRQIARYGHMIDREGRRLGDLVGQVLAFARMQSGEPGLRPEPLVAERQVKAVLEDLRSTLEAAGVSVETRFAPDLPAVVADPGALRRALSNLLSNAVKYGRGSADPWIGVEVSAQGGEVAFTVRDRGPGVDPRDLPDLFEPFFRGRSVVASRTPGSGLGLALVRHLAESHGGRVTASATPGGGATFTLHLPAEDEP